MQNRTYLSIQAARGIAALLVLLYHLGGSIASPKYFGFPSLGVPFAFGNAGVEFFFVLSGFIIYAAHRRDIGRPSALPSYLTKRLIRIYPVYWLVFLLVLGFALAHPALRDTVPHELGVILKSLFLLPQDRAQIGGTGAPVIVVAWTLQYEMLFYSIFALAILSRALGLLAVVLLAALEIACGGATGQCVFPLSFLGSEYVALFGIGIVSGMIVESRKISGYVLLAIGLSGFGILSVDRILGSEIFRAHNAVLFGIACAGIVSGLACEELQGRAWGRHQSLQLLGGASYVLYLIHYPMVSAICKVLVALRLGEWGTTGAVAAFVITLSTCVMTAVAFHLWLERPLMRWLRGKVRQEQTSATNAAMTAYEAP